MPVLFSRRCTASLLACISTVAASGRLGAVDLPAVAVPANVTLEQRLLAEDPAVLAREARETGDASRGAIVFYQPALACTRCHLPAGDAPPLGPDLARLAERPTDVAIVESILSPSKAILKNFEPVALTTREGRTLQGILDEDRDDALVLRDAERLGETITVRKADIDERSTGKTSFMPTGLVNQLADRRQFLDLVKYALAVVAGGPREQLALRPAPSAYLPPPLPAYEFDLDHAGLVSAWNDESFARGKLVYEQVCQSCHGDRERVGSLPAALRFASGKFKNGREPHRMYLTLTRGFSLMAAQTGLSPRQKYDVIHYIREAYLKPHNGSQYLTLDQPYIDRLPKGQSRGPQETPGELWRKMNYGPSFHNTYEVGPDNLAYKGIAVRLDSGPGGVAAGRLWMVYDHDTLRAAAGWQGEGFIDWQGIQFSGAHGVHPHVAGDVVFRGPTGPGWANPAVDLKKDGPAAAFDDPRIVGRDGKRYGPLPREWAHLRGVYHYGQQTILSYTVGQADVLETPGYEILTERTAGAAPAAETQLALTRTLDIGPCNRSLYLRVAPKNAMVAVLASNPTRLESHGDYLVVHVPAHRRRAVCKLIYARPESGQALAAAMRRIAPPRPLAPLTQGGPPRWPQVMRTQAIVAADEGPFAVDVLSPPVDNPWQCQMRCTGFDFFDDGERLALCTWDGDVWIASGLKALKAAGEAGQATTVELAWQRVASGLFQPLGLKLVQGNIFVTCRDQLVVLRDLNGDGETDFYENFNSDHQVTEHFHEFAMGLQVDSAGNFYYAKSARHALPALVPHHGTLLRVSPDGQRTEILARGFRAANGVCLNPDGTFFVTDQEGHWNPKNRINWVRGGGFYGNMFGYHDVTDPSDSAMEQPMCWITNAFDRSPAELLWATGDRWGPLKGSLLNLSYGYGKVYVVPHETVDGQVQGGMCELPIPQFPTGVMRGRFHPQDGQLYLCGMFAWAGNQQQPGGFYRLRYTGRGLHLPVELHAKKGRLILAFTGSLDRRRAADPEHYAVKAWALKRSENYGSDHIGEHALTVRAASVSDDGRTVSLEIPDLQPAWGMEIKYALHSSTGAAVDGVIHHTVHKLSD